MIALPEKTLLAFTLVPVLAAALGSFLPLIWAVGQKVRSMIQHFAAGVVFSVVAVELLPDITRTHDVGEIVLGFAAGVALMLALRHFAESQETDTLRSELESGSRAPEVISRPVSRSAIVATAIDVGIDGLLVGIAFAAGAKEGRLLTLALALELFSLSLALSSQGIAAKRTHGVISAAALPFGLAFMLPIGAILGDSVLRGASTHVLAGVLSFGCAALLFLVTEELLVEAHESPEGPFATAMFFVGFLVLLVLGMVT